MGLPLCFQRAVPFIGCLQPDWFRHLVRLSRWVCVSTVSVGDTGSGCDMIHSPTFNPNWFNHWLGCCIGLVFATVTSRAVSTVSVVVMNGGCVMFISLALFWSLTLLVSPSLLLLLDLVWVFGSHCLRCSGLFPLVVFSGHFNFSISSISAASAASMSCLCTLWLSTKSSKTTELNQTTYRIYLRIGRTFFPENH